MTAEKLPELDSVIHSHIRLAILSILSASKEADFNFLKKTIGTTDGNLSTHLTKLETAGYIKINKAFVNKKPKTTVSMTEKGKAEFSNYLKSLEQILKPAKK